MLARVEQLRVEALRLREFRIVGGCHVPRCRCPTSVGRDRLQRIDQDAPCESLPNLLLMTSPRSPPRRPGPRAGCRCSR